MPGSKRSSEHKKVASTAQLQKIRKGRGKWKRRKIGKRRGRKIKNRNSLGNCVMKTIGQMIQRRHTRGRGKFRRELKRRRKKVENPTTITSSQGAKTREDMSRNKTGTNQTWAKLSLSKATKTQPSSSNAQARPKNRTTKGEKFEQQRSS